VAIAVSLFAGQAAIAAAESRPLIIQAAGTSQLQAEIRGPRFQATTLFGDFEEFDSPNIQRLRRENGLDDVVSGETSEFRKMLKLRPSRSSKKPRPARDFTARTP
jgi:hypothetical protein